MNFSNVPSANIATSAFAVNDTWFNWFSDLISQLQQNLSDEGYVIPAQDADNIALLSNTNNTQRFLFNSTTNAMMVNNTGTYLTLTAMLILSSEQLDTFDLKKLNNGILINSSTDDVYIVRNGIKRKLLLVGDS